MSRSPRSKPFLVLPLLESEFLQRTSPDIFDMPLRNPGLKLFTKTWPSNKNKPEPDKDKTERPLTATLDKPTIIDIRLIGKIDMSKITKELFELSNLCRIPLVIKKAKSSKSSKLSGPLKPALNNSDKKKSAQVIDSCGGDGNDLSSRSVRVTVKGISKLDTSEGKRRVKASPLDNNNNQSKDLKTPRKPPAIHSFSEKSPPSDTIPSTKLPQPCNSCGRSDQPERLHSHPATLNKIEYSQKIKDKSIVQKPIAIKFKSKTTPALETSLKNPHNSIISERTVAPMSILEQCRANYKKKVSSLNSSAPRKVTLTCYICGREYGTHSLPLHEPKCLEKWERENSLLPKNQQRKPPQKPTADPRNMEEWNKEAWELSQNNLVPCENCGRTFYPDRLAVHKKSCKVKTKHNSTEDIKLLNHSISSLAEVKASPAYSPPTINGRIAQQNWQCYICKQKFSGSSIKEHEKQCLERWNLENHNNKPKTSPPIRRKVASAASNALRKPSSSAENLKMERPASSKKPTKPPLFPCYLCGNLFSVNSIYIHEPQCLKKWHIENDKLPPSKRRQVPQKQEIKFTQDGKINYEKMKEDNWQTHLSQLVPCKYCKRTFNPDRIEIHERSCIAAKC